MYGKKCGASRRSSGSRKGAIRLERDREVSKKRQRGRRWLEGETQAEEAGGRRGWGEWAKEVWKSVSCHETGEVLPALIRVSEEHAVQRRFLRVREKVGVQDEFRSAVVGRTEGGR